MSIFFDDGSNKLSSWYWWQWWCWWCRWWYVDDHDIDDNYDDDDETIDLVDSNLVTKHLF